MEQAAYEVGDVSRSNFGLGIEPERLTDRLIYDVPRWHYQLAYTPITGKGVLQSSDVIRRRADPWRRTLGIFMTNQNEALNPALLPLNSMHQCISCGTISGRDDITEEEMITGVLVCRACGHTGPLHLVVLRR